MVSGIVGQRRCSSVFGKENHAGTTPMNMRDDALVKTAEIITYINQKANEADGLAPQSVFWMYHQTLVCGPWSG